MKKLCIMVAIIFLLPHFNAANNHTFHYYSYDEMLQNLQKLKEKYPDIFTLHSLGKSYGGRDIFMVKISDNVSIDENEAEILFMAAHHGNEKPGYQFLLYFMEAICANYGKNESIAYLVNNAEIFIIPMVNPDGVENNTRKNMEPNGCLGENVFPVMKGVNLNRNYDAGWNEWKPWYFLSTTATPYGDLLLHLLGYPPEYRGEKPFSEKETKAIKEFVENRSFVIAIDFHTGAGEIIFYPFGYTDEKPKDITTFISIAENISRINNYSFREAGKAAIGMAIDWMYEKEDIYAFIIELSREVAPSEEEKVKEIFEKNLPVNYYLIDRAIRMHLQTLYTVKI